MSDPKKRKLDKPDEDPLTKESTWSERGQHLLDKGAYSDCQFELKYDGETKVFKLHTQLLIWASSGFDAILRKTKKVVVTDVPIVFFHAMIRFIYTGELRLENVYHAVRLYETAVKYSVVDLKNKCVEGICRTFTRDTTWLILQCGYKYKDKRILELATYELKYNCTEVLSFKGKEDVDLGVWEYVLDQEYLKIKSEFELYIAVVMWTEKECQKRKLETSKANRRLVILPLLKKLRLLTLTQEEFNRGPGISGLLTSEEVVAVICNIVKPGSSPVPDTLCSSTKMRNYFPELKELQYDNLVELYPGGGPHHQSRDDTRVVQEHFTVTHAGVLEGVGIPSQSVNRDALRRLYPNVDPSGYEEKMEISIFKNNVKADSWICSQRVQWDDVMGFRIVPPLLVAVTDVITVVVKLFRIGWYALSKPKKDTFNIFDTNTYNGYCFVFGFASNIPETEKKMQ